MFQHTCEWEVLLKTVRSWIRKISEIYSFLFLLKIVQIIHWLHELFFCSAVYKTYMVSLTSNLLVMTNQGFCKLMQVRLACDFLRGPMLRTSVLCSPLCQLVNNLVYSYSLATALLVMQRAWAGGSHVHGGEFQVQSLCGCSCFHVRKGPMGKVQFLHSSWTRAQRTAAQNPLVSRLCHPFPSNLFGWN